MPIQTADIQKAEKTMPFRKTRTDMTDEKLFAEVTAFDQLRSLSLLTPTALQRLTAERGFDFAMALLYDRVVKSPRHQPLVEWMNRTGDVPETPIKPRGRVIVVPALYDPKKPEEPPTGRFAQRVAERLGFETTWLEVPPHRTLAVGSAKVRDAILSSSEPVTLISLSRSSLDVKLALGGLTHEEQQRRVRGWLSITGLMKGSPVVNALYERALLRFATRRSLRRSGLEEAVMLDLMRGPGTPTCQPLSLSPRIPLVHLFAFPRQRHFIEHATNSEERGWMRLLRFLKIDSVGPHEGASVHGDLLDEPGQIAPVWGVPHWICPGWNIDERVARALQYLEQHSNHETDRNGSEQPSVETALQS